MGQAKRRGTYEQRKAAAIKHKQLSIINARKKAAEKFANSIKMIPALKNFDIKKGSN